jgi:hypothetical protein
METNVVLLDVKKMDKKLYPNLDMPTVNLCGKWFLDAGFQPGDSVVGEVFEDAILIRKVKKISEKDLKIIQEKIKSIC